MACRSQTSYDNAVATILSATSTTDTKQENLGELRPMIFDLADLRTIKPAVEKFLSGAERLDVLFNNAAVMNPPKDSVPKQVSVLTPSGQK